MLQSKIGISNQVICHSWVPRNLLQLVANSGCGRPEQNQGRRGKNWKIWLCPSCAAACSHTDAKFFYNGIKIKFYFSFEMVLTILIFISAKDQVIDKWWFVYKESKLATPVWPSAFYSLTYNASIFCWHLMLQLHYLLLSC